MADVSRQVPGVHLVGNIIWYHTNFLKRYLPRAVQAIDKKQIALVRAVREQYLSEKSANIPR